MALISTGAFFFDLFLVLAAACLAIYVYFIHAYQYWKNKGVPYLEPTFPYGNNTVLFSQTTTYGSEAKAWYDNLKAKGAKFGGAWTFSRKVLVLVDPVYIKDILTLDFNYFIDRDVYSNEKKDPVGTHLFGIRNPNWKPLRQKLTPTFTSGKMKIMFDGVVQCSKYMIEHMERCSKSQQEINTREVLASFTTDVIASVAFGVESNSFDGTPSEFRKQARLLFSKNFFEKIRISLFRGFPELSRHFAFSSKPTEIRRFFTDLVKQTMEYRIKNNVRRPDFLQLLIDMYNDEEPDKSLNLDQIVANTILFFVAGFDTSSSASSLALFELAKNPDIQEKARQEVNSVLKKYDNQLTYDSIQEMTYLRQVMDEGMRIYPPVLTLSRICTKDYQLRDTDITIEKGTSVVVSTYGLGRDAELFPNPMKFDPDRFSPENKAKIKPFAHLPFGEGPRNCIGLRFGVMQTKIALASILSNFKISVSPKMKLPLEIDETIFLLKEKSPIYLTLEKI